MNVQLQMRRNVEQMHATADDLADFMKDIGKRDRSLRGMVQPDAAKKADADDGTDEEEEAREIEEELLQAELTALVVRYLYFLSIFA